MNFDKMTERRGTHSSKWDKMEQLFGVSPEDGLAMWTADSDYETAPCVIEAARKAVEHGVFGYSWEYDAYKEAVAWWMRTRHNWDVNPDSVLSSQGLGNAIALCLQTFTQPGDGIIIFTPVYHEFALKIGKNGRKVVECPLKRVGDRYELDLEDAQSRLTGNEKMILWCSPQNPSGRVWTEAELKAVAAFAEKNDLMLVSDEIHQDLVYPDHKFVPTAVAAPEVISRLITLTAASKTFNIAGQRTGNMIIPDDDLRNAMRGKLYQLDYAPGMLAVSMITAAYSPEGAEWADAQIAHLERNRKMFDEAINAIPGVKSMPLEATYLAWVDFSDTGMTHDEVIARIRDDAKIAVSPGPSFGIGGDGFQRFNLATQGARVEDAIERMQRAFADLQ
ncbi:MalY/PatB family protein [Aliiroseovarius sp. PrR006]|uniref:MalY/PatB family protein n=1 Tax=Aliiroseovarius sp. PrR006 TaxID=2706883 RepID=UPI0013D1EEC6|nr:MalY/PatB family protein [Aliiroseovarius sp. PrR006]NDW54690.1 pyridoxal phosphate-dependent aminotransferase [Aliiroseovarius sp. PrR006]